MTAIDTRTKRMPQELLMMTWRAEIKYCSKSAPNASTKLLSWNAAINHHNHKHVSYKYIVHIQTNIETYIASIRKNIMIKLYIVYYLYRIEVVLAQSYMARQECLEKKLPN